MSKSKLKTKKTVDSVKEVQSIEETQTLKQQPKKIEPSESGVFKKIKGLSRVVKIFTVSGIVAVFLAVVLIIGLFVLGRQEEGTNFAFYIKDGQLYCLNIGSQPIKVTKNLTADDDDNDIDGYIAEFGYEFYISSDKMFLIYSDEYKEDLETGTISYTLYHRTLSEKSHTTVKIDSGITDWKISESDNKIIYRQQNAQKGNCLKISDFSKSSVLDYGVEDYYLNREGSAVVYTTQSGVNRISDGQKTVICDKGVVEFVSDDLATVYYSFDNSLYKWSHSETTLVLSDVEMIYKVYGQGEVYFLRAASTKCVASDYIYDDLAASDASMVYPTYPKAPNIKHYKTEEDYLVDFEKFTLELTEYNHQIELFKEKQRRDKLRKSIETLELDLTTYTLYYFDGKKETVISRDFNYTSNLTVIHETVPLIAFKEYSRDAKIRFSNIDSLGDVKSAILEGFGSLPEFKVASRAKVSVVSPKGQVGNVTFDQNGRTIYFIDEFNLQTGVGNLYSSNVDTATGKVFSYDGGVDAESVCINGSNDIVYSKSEKAGLLKILYINGQAVAKNVEMNNVVYCNDISSYVFYTDYNVEKSKGTLNIYKEGSTPKTFADVSGYGLTTEGDIMYILGYDTKTSKGDLYYWNGEESVKIASKISCAIN